MSAPIPPSSFLHAEPTLRVLEVVHRAHKAAPHAEAVDKATPLV